jgi:hypothetical protein
MCISTAQRDDFEDIRGWHSSMWPVPAYKNSSGDLVCLLGPDSFFNKISMVTPLEKKNQYT